MEMDRIKQEVDGLYDAIMTWAGMRGITSDKITISSDGSVLLVKVVYPQESGLPQVDEWIHVRMRNRTGGLLGVGSLGQQDTFLPMLVQKVWRAGPSPQILVELQPEHEHRRPQSLTFRLDELEWYQESPDSPTYVPEPDEPDEPPLKLIVPDEDGGL